MSLSNDKPQARSVDLWTLREWETKRVGSTEWQPLDSIAVQITERELIGVGVAYHERGQ